MRVKGEVTKSDIRHGLRRNDCACPLALSLRRRFSYVWVGRVSIIAIARNGRFYSVVTPSEIYRFIERFDNNLEVKPFKYEIDFRIKPKKK